MLLVVFDVMSAYLDQDSLSETQLLSFIGTCFEISHCQRNIGLTLETLLKEVSQMITLD